jgi:hypothetical protein
MSFLNQLKQKQANANPAQAPKAAQPQQAKTPAGFRPRFAGKLNTTESQKQRSYLKSPESKGMHVLKIIKVSAGTLPEHSGGDEFFGADFEVVESDSLQAGTERSWISVDGKFDYYAKEVKAFLEGVLGSDPTIDYDEMAIEAIGEENPLAGQLVIAECYETKKANPKTGEKYVNVRWMQVPADYTPGTGQAA